MQGNGGRLQGTRWGNFCASVYLSEEWAFYPLPGALAALHP